jgi:hypothetical protein
VTSNVRLQKSELTAEVIDEIFSPLLMGGRHRHCCHRARNSSGHPLFPSLDCNGPIPTMRGILGDEKAFAYFEGSLKESREQHPFLGRSYPESAASFAAKFAEGAIGKSGKKISVKGLATRKVGGYPT